MRFPSFIPALLPALLAALLALLPCCATTDRGTHESVPRDSLRVAVLPALWTTAASQPHDGLDREAMETLSSQHGLTACPLQDVASALAAQNHAACQDDLGCVQSVARATRADKAIVLKLAELGGTIVVRASLVDARTATLEQTQQRIVQGTGTNAVPSAVREVAAALAKPLVPEPVAERQQWYQRWWAWAALAGVVVAGSAVAFGLAADDGPPGPDVIIRPP